MPELPDLTRASILERLAAGVATLPRPARVAIDGVDAAGKTTIADDLARLIGKRGLRVDRLCADDFLRPPEERYRRGRESPEGYLAAVRPADLADAIIDNGDPERPQLRLRRGETRASA